MPASARPSRATGRPPAASSRKIPALYGASHAAFSAAASSRTTCTSSAVGFLKAIDGFDESFGTRFSTYAVPKISGEIRRFLRDDGAVKVSRGIKEQAAQIRAARLALEQRIGREPNISELVEETGFSAEEIAFAEVATGPAESLQRENGDDGFTLELILGDYTAEEKLVEHVALRAAIEKLPEKERQVVALRYYHGMTQQNCAKVMHVSQVQISRLERRAVDALRAMLE